ncbi:MAG: hypothetical protein QOD58_1547, partial [Mycobacterium sp.]|nr:hypothetical protein [Mycobacterium sp.]
VAQGIVVQKTGDLKSARDRYIECDCSDASGTQKDQLSRQIAPFPDEKPAPDCSNPCMAMVLVIAHSRPAARR